MKLYIGGAFQGKLSAALSGSGLSEGEVTDGAVCAPEDIFHARILDHFHLYLRRALEEGRETDALVPELVRRNPQIILVCDELGCGVVPIDGFDRAWRELTGRTLSALAERSDEVWRIVCGIGVKLK